MITNCQQDHYVKYYKKNHYPYFRFESKIVSLMKYFFYP